MPITANLPGVYVRQLDLSDYAQLLSATIYGCVGVALKGPLHHPVLITSEKDLIDTFGPPPDSAGGAPARQRLTVSVGSSGSFVLRFGATNTSSIAFNAAASAVATALNTAINTDLGTSAVVYVTASGAVGGPWVITFTGGVLLNREIPPLLVTTQPTGGTLTVAVLARGSATPSDFAMLSAVMFLREGNQLYFTRTCEIDSDGEWLATIAQTLGDGLSGSVEYDNTGGHKSILFKAKSPGEWGNSLRVKFTKLAGGSQNERQSLVFSDLTSGADGQTFRLKVGSGGTNSADIVFNHVPATLRANVKTALDAIAVIDTVSVTGSGSASDPIVVEFTGTSSYTDIETLVTVAGGTGTSYLVANTITVAVVNEGVTPAADLYKLEVQGPLDVTGATIGTVEVFDRVMLINDESVLAENNAYYIADLVNSGIRNVRAASKFVTIDPTTMPTTTDDIVVPIVLGDPQSAHPRSTDTVGFTTYGLFGGYAAINAARSGNDDLLAAAYIGTEDDPGNATLGLPAGPTGMQVYGNVESIHVNVMAIPGVVLADVLDAMINLCETRQDCMAIIDTPSGLSASDAVDWHNRGGDFTSTGFVPDSSYAAMYWPWLQVFDTYNRRTIFVPPSCLVPGMYARSDALSAPWYAPAGETRGQMKYALALESRAPSRGALDNMYGGGNVINPIIDFVQRGIVAWGQRTTQRRATALDRVNVQRMLFVVETSISLAARSAVMEPNDEATWNRIRGLAEPLLQQVKNGRGVEDYKIICDATTNPPELRDQNKVRGVIFVKPVHAAEVIQLDFAAVSTGAEFDIKLVTP